MLWADLAQIHYMVESVSMLAADGMQQVLQDLAVHAAHVDPAHVAVRRPRLEEVRGVGLSGCEGAGRCQVVRPGGPTAHLGHVVDVDRGSLGAPYRA